MSIRALILALLVGAVLFIGVCAVGLVAWGDVTSEDASGASTATSLAPTATTTAR